MEVEAWLESKLPILDVRSPGEYARGHIPGAISLPLFDDEERAEIGTLYKQEGPEAALLRGLDRVGPKMSALVRSAQAAAPQKRLAVHCWRGGMRSASVAWLLQLAGFEVYTLAGGYKAWRRWALEQFAQPRKLVLLGGKTGSGKTLILRAIQQLGGAVIDLEALACHKGSAFGALGQPPQPTNEQFENNLALALRQHPVSKPLWLEDESYTIGKIHLPEALWKQMLRAPLVYADAPAGERIERLAGEYGNYPPAELELAVQKISRRLGGENTAAALEALRAGELKKAAGVLLNYYDKAYHLSLKKREIAPLILIAIPSGDPEAAASMVLNELKRIKDPL